MVRMFCSGRNSNQLLFESVLELALGNGEVEMFIVGDQVAMQLISVGYSKRVSVFLRFLQERPPECVLGLIGSLLNRKISCSIRDKWIFCFEVKACVRKGYIDSGAPNFRVSDGEVESRIRSQQCLMYGIIDPVHCGRRIPGQTKRLFKHLT